MTLGTKKTPTELRRMKWQCAECKKLNWAHHLACALCGTPRPAALAALALLLGLTLLAAPVRADPPEGAPSPYADWYRGLATPEGGSCCSLSDGRTTEVRFVRGATEAEDHWEAWIDGRFPGGINVGWVAIPPQAVLHRTDNPTGEPVVFWRPARGVICFVRPIES